jgi:hypothetical protein
LITLRAKIAREKLIGTHRARHADPNGSAEMPVPGFGPHDLVPSVNREIWNPPARVRDTQGGEA